MTRQSMGQRQQRRTIPQRVIDASRSRDAAIQKMNPKLFAMLQTIESVNDQIRAGNIRHYYAVGKHWCEVRDKPEEYLGNDGTAGVTLLETALATHATTLRRCGKFAEEFSEKDMETLATLKAPQSKFQIHWGHLVVLMTAPAESRMDLAVECAENMWDPKDLHTTIKDRWPRERQGHGPRPRVPVEVGKQVDQILKVTQAWLKRFKEAWMGQEDNQTNVFNNIMEMKESQYDHLLLDGLEKTALSFVDMEEALRAIHERCNEVAKHVRDKLPGNEPAATARRTRRGGSQPRQRLVDV